MELQGTSLQRRAESYLGTGIAPSEFEAARPDAERKLQYIIDREGDANGARRELDYLAQLIAETVRSDRLRQITAALADCYETIGTKRQPVSENTGPPLNHPYCTTAASRMQ